MNLSRKQIHSQRKTNSSIKTTCCSLSFSYLSPYIHESTSPHGSGHQEEYLLSSTPGKCCLCAAAVTCIFIHSSSTRVALRPNVLRPRLVCTEEQRFAKTQAIHQRNANLSGEACCALFRGKNTGILELK